MVFANNSLQLMHTSGCNIEFNALDALKRVCNGKLGLKIACADAWKESRMESGHMDEVKPFDWTFTTDYKGTLTGGFAVTPTDSRIDVEKLRQREKILFYHDLLLFEDELHDNGTAVCSVKIRVMPSSFFILLRYFLRIDSVMLRMNDTRYYHEFGSDFILREYTSREAKAQDLSIPPSRLVDPSEIARFLPLVTSCYEKLILPSTKLQPDDTTAVK
ncbi:TIP41-like protein [Zootermopsis nevadensis]|uniref:TIP41-like protein n=1 Tax=Zootermopsis nevadensis TaxID=136037 RepID=UPI000B8E7991|nr:TIP41-like protein [Zootermopsis nevadensis]